MEFQPLGRFKRAPTKVILVVISSICIISGCDAALAPKIQVQTVPQRISPSASPVPVIPLPSPDTVTPGTPAGTPGGGDIPGTGESPSESLQIQGAPQGHVNGNDFRVTVTGIGFAGYRWSLVDGNGCEGTIDSATQPFSARIEGTLGADGMKTLCVRGVRTDGTLQKLATVASWTKDTVAPEGTLVGGPTGVTSQTSYSVQVVGTDVAQYSHAIQSGTNCENATFGSWRLATQTISGTVSGDGQVILCVRLKDLAGNIALLPVSKSWTVDSTPPVAALTGLPSAITNVTSLSVNVSIPDGDSYSFSIVNGTSCATASFGTWSASNVLLQATIESDGVYSLCVKGRDAAGNVQLSPTSHSWEVDTQAPASVTLTGAPTALSNALAYQITVGGAGVSRYRWAEVDEATCTNAVYSSWLSTTQAITAATGAEGTKTLCVLGGDGAGNNQTAPTLHSWFKDSLPPVSTLSGTPDAVTASDLVAVTVGGVGVTDYSYTIVNGNTCSGATYGGWSESSETIISSVSGDGQKTLCVRGRDSAGNVQTTPTSFTWVFDTTPPTAVLSGTPAAVTSSTAASITVSAVGGTEYSAVLALASDCSGISPVGFVNLSTPFSASSLADAIWTLCVWAVDAAGNRQTSPTAYTWEVDTQAPGTVDLVDLPDLFSSASSISVGVSGADVQTYVYAVNDGTDCTGAVYGLPRAVTTRISGSLGSDGDKTLCVKGIDAAGNIQATPDSWTWVKDSAPPSPPTVSLVTPAGGFSTAAAYAISIGNCLDGSRVLFKTTSGTPSSGEFDSSGISCVTGPAFSGSVLAGKSDFYVWSQDLAKNISTTSSALWMVRVDAPPSLSMNSLGNLRGGQSTAVQWTLTSQAATAAQAFSLELSTDNGTTWGVLTSVSAIDGVYGALNAQPFSWNWTVPTVDASAAKVRISFTDAAGQTTSTTSNAFSIDSQGPALASDEFKINNGAAVTTSRGVSLAFRATDNLNSVTHYCVKYSVPALQAPTAPNLTDTCWCAVASIPAAPSSNLWIPAVPQALGFVPGDYHLFLWARDEVGNISTLTGATGTPAKDQASITLNANEPPFVFNVQTSATDSPATPLGLADLTVAAGNTVVVKWKATDDAALAATAMAVEFSTDDQTYVPAATNLANAVNGACTVDGSTHTGCYAWTNGSPSSSYFRVRVQATDTGGLSARGVANAMNVASVLSPVAGNTDVGLGGSGASATFVTANPSVLDAEPGGLVVMPDGRVFFRNGVSHDIYTINPADGVLRLFLRYTGTPTGDGGVVSSATVGVVLRMVPLGNDKLYLLEADRIRVVNLTTQVITRIVGGGGDSGVEVTPATSASFLLNDTQSFIQFPNLTVMPNGNIFFGSENIFTTPAGFRILFFNAATNTLHRYTPTGMIQRGVTPIDISECTLMGTGADFDDATSTLETIFVSSYICSVDASAVFSVARLSPVFQGNTALTVGMAQASCYDYYVSYFNSPSGRAYRLSRQCNKLERFERATNTWTHVLGNGSGVCAEGTMATDCKIDLMDAYVGNGETIYFLDGSRIRTVDHEGKVRNFLGQSNSYGDGGLATSARFSNLKFIAKWHDGTNTRIVAADAGNKRLREVVVGGNISTLAGTGTTGPIPWNSPAATSDYHYAYHVAAHPTTGDVFASHFGAAGCAGAGIARLNRGTGYWEPFVDCIPSSWTQYTVGDGVAGGTIYSGYAMNVLAVEPSLNKLLAFAGSFDYGILNYRDNMLKTYDLSTAIQSHLAGPLQIGIPSAWGADGSPVATSTVPEVGHYLQHSLSTPVWSDHDGKWLMLSLMTPQRIVGLPPGGLVETYASLSEPAVSFAYQYSAAPAKDIIYYCSATSKRLRSHDRVSHVETELSWPIASIACDGQTLLFDAARNSLFFPYKQNGLWGILEYHLP